MSPTIVTPPIPPGSLSTLADRAPDEDALRAIVARRLALQLGVSLSLAAAVAQLAGLGPRDRRSSR